MLLKVVNGNADALRDCIRWFPADKLDSHNANWCWGIDDLGYLHVKQNPNCEVDAILDVKFEGDGVIVLSLRDKRNDKEVIREFYDDHGNDGGARFLKLLAEMDPQSATFGGKTKTAWEHYAIAKGYIDG